MALGSITFRALLTMLVHGCQTSIFHIIRLSTTIQLLIPLLLLLLLLFSTKAESTRNYLSQAPKRRCPYDSDDVLPSRASKKSAAVQVEVALDRLYLLSPVC